MKSGIEKDSKPWFIVYNINDYYCTDHLLNPLTTYPLSFPSPSFLSCFTTNTLKEYSKKLQHLIGARSIRRIVGQSGHLELLEVLDELSS